MAGGIHDGHRSRMKENMIQNGIDQLEPHQVLEMLLFYSIPRVDTNPLAHRLIDHFGGLAEVLEADYEQLKKVDGVSDHTASLLVLFHHLFRRYHCEKAQENTVFHSLDEIGKYLKAQFLNEKQEKLRIMCLNNRGELLNCSVISVGSLTSTSVDIRGILDTMMRYPTTAIVMAHNHPAGFALPSAEDYESTIRVRKALEYFDVRLVDHMVFAQDDYTSMRLSPRFAGAFSIYARDDSALEWLK